MEILLKIIYIAIAVLLGSVPSAYLISKKFLGKDITQEGSGMVGAMNTYEVSGNKYLGIATFLLDAFKGVLIVLIGHYLFWADMYMISMASVFAIMAHNYNPWLKFHGGKGLATSVGIFLLISPVGILHWCFIWFASYNLFGKKINVANIFACIASPILVFYAPDMLLHKSSFVGIDILAQYKILFTLICSIILVKHASNFSEIKTLFKGDD